MNLAAWGRSPIGQSCLGAAAAVLLIVLTGGAYSPLTFVLILPVLSAAARGGLAAGLTLALALAVLELAVAWGHGTPVNPMAALSAAFSLPVAALAGVWLERRAQQGMDVVRASNDELSTLVDISQMLDAAYDLDMMLNLILLNVQKLSGCQVCAIYLEDASGQNLDLRAASGLRDRVALLPSLPIAGARSGDWAADALPQVAQHVVAFYTPDTDRADREGTSRLFDVDRRARSFACVPLTSMEGLLGMLYVGFDAPQGLTPHGLKRIERLTTRAAFALQRVLLQHDAESMAYSDAMTGLDNFRQFERSLGEELCRAERYGHKLSVILLDIDHFKKFNDTLGHQAGDALLAQIGIVLRNELRTSDKPARYGGEEFVIVCPETGRDEAHLIAERIRRSIAATAFTLGPAALDQRPEGGATTHVTVSVGFATFPVDSETAPGLVKKADAALYAAKAAGRNAVRGADEDAPHLLTA